MSNEEPEIPLRDIGLKARNLKCFGDEPQGFDRILPINVVIGRNNSGKSALLDLVEYAFTDRTDRWRGRSGRLPTAVLRRVFTAGDAQSIPSIRHNLRVNDGQFVYWDPKDFVQDYVGSLFDCVLKQGGRNSPTSVVLPSTPTHKASVPPDIYREDKIRTVCQLGDSKVESGLPRMRFRRIFADRDISPEKENHKSSLNVSYDGRGLTLCIERLLHDASENERLIEPKLLDALNQVFHPDLAFVRIDAHRQTVREANQMLVVWEVRLQENGSFLVPLSQMGSGVKTVLLVLANMLVVPELPSTRDKVPLSQHVFAFEELENNLHPALQRRLFAFIQDFAKEHGSTFFITTHSNVVIDFFSRDPDAQLIHVTRDGDESRARTVSLPSEHSAVLDDLGVRASDLLQTNVVVWVEGPSDRIYFDAWIEKLTGGELRQGLHYQCVFYGGAVLSHFTVDEDGADDREVKDLVEAMKVCRKAVLLADSDRRKEEDELKPRLERVVGEAGDSCLTWVTACREVERYAPAAVLTELLGEEEATSRYGDLPKSVTRSKVEFARKVVEHEAFAPQAIRETLDLGDKLDEVIAFIREANGLV